MNNQLNLYSSYTKFIFKENGGDIYFNLRSFLEKQALIWTKYDSLESGLSLRTSEKKFIDKFDKYILHTLEEVYEALKEFENPNSKEDTMNELIDILMYLGTMNSIIEYNFKEFENEEFPIKDNLNINCRNINPKELCNDVLSYLIASRRLYNKRKWHKISVEMCYLEKLQALIDTACFITEAMQIVLSSILFMSYIYDFSIDDINILINKKQTFILSL